MPFYPASVAQVGHFVSDAVMVKQIQAQNLLNQLLINTWEKNHNASQRTNTIKHQHKEGTIELQS